jgi:hypothetical protein
MKYITKYLLAALLLTGSTYAFAQTDLIAHLKLDTINKHVSGLTEIKIGGPFDVQITQGSTEGLTMYAPTEIVDRIVTEVSGGVLKIQNKHDNWSSGEKSWWSEKSWWRRHPGKIKVFVTVKDISSVSLSGSGEAVFANGITANALKLKVRGSGNITGKIQVKTLQSSVSGSGNIKLSGTAETSTVKVTGSGNFMALDLVTTNSAAHISGSGNAEINANDKLDAAISGSGGVRYMGAVKTINSKKSGSGSISKI